MNARFELQPRLWKICTFPHRPWEQSHLGHWDPSAAATCATPRQAWRDLVSRRSPPPWPWRSVSLALPTEHLSESIVAHCIIKDATTLVTGAHVAYARGIAFAPERACIPHALGHSAHLLRVC